MAKNSKIRKRVFRALLDAGHPSSCAFCGKPGDDESLEIDHIVPVSRIPDPSSSRYYRRPQLSVRNIRSYRLLCPPCNTRKWNHLDEEFLDIAVAKRSEFAAQFLYWDSIVTNLKTILEGEK